MWPRAAGRTGNLLVRPRAAQQPNTAPGRLGITGDNTSSTLVSQSGNRALGRQSGACVRVQFNALSMLLTPEDVNRIAMLARLELSTAERAAMLSQLNGFFGIVEQMSAVDTSGVEPLYTPLSAVQAVALRLRDDVVTESRPARAQPGQRTAGRGRPVPGAEGRRMSAALHDLGVAQLGRALQSGARVEPGADATSAHAGCGFRTSGRLPGARPRAQPGPGARRPTRAARAARPQR